mmetsp:Transcript_37885/g.89975  ORF Transcript_37885/g.89975 Transcript_37885/m.89975 type:complete len:212 (+) Transcript_37885:389-1024(+)|eukprot:CAMPEP_0177588828 /NCGR_PEP_ID=MMETSP0419_2-20121207/6448_1 /TAXON_ID=582737 /ORGANISM="Tetraselmis sp., Strain GSL018" /LENGTH=211 /DNA_ID=CAMNT_0019079081 /DNA_START=382 /DNA_END=1017 /DNA_ORIENTATION=+
MAQGATRPCDPPNLRREGKKGRGTRSGRAAPCRRQLPHNVLAVPRDEPPVVLHRGSVDDVQKVANGFLDREQLIRLYVLLEGGREIRLGRPRVQQEARHAVPPPRRLDRHRPGHLVERRLGAPVGVPPAEPVVPDASNPGREVGDHSGALRRGAPLLFRRGQQRHEVLAYQHRPDGVGLEAQVEALGGEPGKGGFRHHPPWYVKDTRRVDE